ncbi:MAG: GlsB/YeaQ/YmgE family stress response membrane protein [Saprospiraceae bacterium]|nr:GlsB/YeaQ/YmgE family stress response membrane protein [Saprospiraceae bacterium]
MGAIASWLGSNLLKGSSSGLIVEIVLGIIRPWAFGVLNINISGGVLTDIIKCTTGTVLVLFIYNLSG